jgi:hypothetical protein
VDSLTPALYSIRQPLLAVAVPWYRAENGSEKKRQ